MAKLYFREDTEPIITEILKNNQVEDSDEIFMQKLSAGKPLPGGVIFSAVEKIVLENLPKKDVCNFLASGLGTSDEISEKIYNDISLKLVPIAEKQPLQETQPEAIQKKEEIPLEVPKAIKKQPPIKEAAVVNPVKTSGGGDRYREPIE